MTRTIAILGLGAMGSRMAARLLDAGHDLRVFNRSPGRADALVQRGATEAKSPAHAARGCDLVISCVRDDEASRSVWLDPDDGALVGMADGATAIESSTLTLEWARRLAETMRDRGRDFVDAPVAGSRPQAEAGALVYLAGGDARVVDRVRDVLLAMGQAVHHVGPAGSGTVLKLAVNALFGIQVAALAEVLGMTRRAGIDDAAAIETLRAMPVTSPALAGVGALMAARSFAPMFPIDLVEKDFGYIVRTATALGSRSPVAAATHGVFAHAQREGLGGDNIVGVAKLFD